MMRSQATLGIASLFLFLACAGCGGSTSAPSSRGFSGGVVTHQAPPSAHQKSPSTNGAAICRPQAASGSTNLLPCYKVTLPAEVRSVPSP